MSFVQPARADAARDKGYHTYKIGDVDCISVYDGIWKKKHDAGFIRNASVEETKKALGAAGLGTDYVPIEFAQTVIKTGTRTILIDAGTGGQLPRLTPGGNDRGIGRRHGRPHRPARRRRAP